MANDKPSGAAGQEPAAAQPQAGTNPPGQEPGTQPAEPAAAAPEGGIGDSRLAFEVEGLRKELADTRKRNAKVEEILKQREREGMSDLDKASARIADLERQNAELALQQQDREVRLAAFEAANRLGFRSPDVAYRLLDRAAIEYTAEGTPRNVDRLLKSVLDAEPYLAKSNGAPDYGGGPRGKTPSGAPSMNELLKRAAGG